MIAEKKCDWDNKDSYGARRTLKHVVNVTEKGTDKKNKGTKEKKTTCNEKIPVCNVQSLRVLVPSVFSC